MNEPRATTAELTIQTPAGAETYSATVYAHGGGHADNFATVAALGKVTAAVWAVHRPELVAARNVVSSLMHLLGYETPKAPEPHGVRACPDRRECDWHRDAAVTYTAGDTTRAEELDRLRAAVVALLTEAPAHVVRRIADEAADWPNGRHVLTGLMQLRMRAGEPVGFRLVEVDPDGKPLVMDWHGWAGCTNRAECAWHRDTPVPSGDVHGWAECTDRDACMWHRGLPAPFDGMRPWPDPANPGGQRGHSNGLGCNDEECRQLYHFTLPEPPF